MSGPVRPARGTDARPGYDTMTDSDDAGDPTPKVSADDSTDTDQTTVTPTQAAEAITEYRHTLGQTQADAMEFLADQRGVETEADLYESGGFPGEIVTVELDLFSAEVYMLIDLLDQLLTRRQPAQKIVPTARVQDEILHNTPDEQIATWLEREGVDFTTTQDTDDPVAADGGEPAKDDETDARTDE